MIELIKGKGVKIFLFGSRSDFDKICLKAVTELKNVFPEIKRVYVRGEYPYIDDGYKDYILKMYEETYFPTKAKKAGKAVYIVRNAEMVEKSDFCVFYYDKKTI